MIALGPVVQPCHLPDLITLGPVVQPCRLPDFVSLGSVDHLLLAAGRAIILYELYIVVLLARQTRPSGATDLMHVTLRSSPCRCTSPCPTCHLPLATQSIIFLTLHQIRSARSYSRCSALVKWHRPVPLSALLCDQMPKTRPARRRRPATTSDGLPDDRTISGHRRSRKASTAAAPAADTNTPGPSGVGAEPAWVDQLPDRLHRLQHPDDSQRGSEREANCCSGPIVDSASNPSPGGRGTGSAGFNFGCYDRYRSFLHIHTTFHTHIQSGSLQNQAKLPEEGVEEFVH